MSNMIYLAVTAAAAIWGYVVTRTKLRVKLRYVDAVQRGTSPLLAGGLAGLAAWLIPTVVLPMAAIFGISIALGVAAGAKDIRNGNAGLIER